MPSASCFDSQPPWMAVNLLPGVLRAAAIQTPPLQLSGECCWQCYPHPQQKPAREHHSPPGNAFCCSSTGGWAVSGNTPVLSQAAPILSAAHPMGHQELPSSPSRLPAVSTDSKSCVSLLHRDATASWMLAMNCSHRPASSIPCQGNTGRHFFSTTQAFSVFFFL